jgi:hypothetical protein
MACKFPGFFLSASDNYCFQIIETGFAEQFWASHRMGSAQILLKFSARKSLKRDPSNDTKFNPTLFHWSIPLKRMPETDDNISRKNLKRNLMCLRKENGRRSVLKSAEKYFQLNLENEAYLTCPDRLFIKFKPWKLVR